MSTRHGYGCLGIKLPDGRWRILDAHRAVREVHDGPAGELNVLHRCGNKACLNLDHTYLGTQKQNAADAARLGELLYGESIANSKLTAEAVAEIRERYIPRVVTQWALAREYGVNQSVISKIVGGKAWRH